MLQEVDRTFDLGLGHGHRLRLADAGMLEILARIERTADSRMPFLITGSTGVGKELAARAVHHYSRRTGPLVCLNCGGMPDAILESEFFGHEQGAFTGAHTSRPGLFEAARKGTIFLDEIAEMPIRSQVTLLRVLDGHPVMRLGGRSSIEIDARVVAATNCEMAHAVASGRFRADLYHRLRGLHVHLPALCERPADIRLLAQVFLDAATDERTRPRIRVSDEVIQLLLLHGWPGNARELKHLMRLAAIECTGEVLMPEHLPVEIRALQEQPRDPDDGKRDSFYDGYSLADEMRALEHERIVQALSKADGVQAHAARILGMPRRTLVRKLQQQRLTHMSRDGVTH